MTSFVNEYRNKYQLPIKKHNGEYDCVSKNDTGNYYDSKTLYNQLKDKLADNIV